MTVLSRLLLLLALSVFSVVSIVLEERFGVVIGVARWSLTTFLLPLGDVVIELLTINRRSRVNQWQKDAAVALSRINKEWKNIKTIKEAPLVVAQRKQDAKDAVEVASFELIELEIGPMEQYWSTWWLTRGILAEAKRNKGKAVIQMNVTQLLSLLTKLRAKLEKVSKPSA